MIAFLKRAFIDPFASPDRFRLYLGTVLGCSAFSGLILYFAFDFLSHGPWVLAAYFLTKSIFGNIFLMPFLFWLAQRFPERPYFIGLLILQGIILLPLIVTPLDQLSMLSLAFLFSLLFSLFSASFWLLYHVLVIHSSSDANLGNEVSIANIGSSIGSMIGYFIGGLIFAFLPGTWFVMLCFAGLLGSSILLLSAIPLESPVQTRSGNVFQSLFHKPWQSVNTMLDGASHFLISFFAPVWLGFIGLSSVATGIVSALGIACKIASSPFTGHWFHTTKMREGKVGATLITAGWAPWAVIQSPFVLLWSYFFWTTGSHMFAVGLQSRWYTDKTYANMAAREVALGIGRSLTCILALILIHIDIQYFFLMALGLALSMILVTSKESKV
ncbi:MAG: MFS transporter [Pseudomonadota bacterium]